MADVLLIRSPAFNTLVSSSAISLRSSGAFLISHSVSATPKQRGDLRTAGPPVGSQGYSS